MAVPNAESNRFTPSNCAWIRRRRRRRRRVPAAGTQAISPRTDIFDDLSRGAGRVRQPHQRFRPAGSGVRRHQRGDGGPVAFLQRQPLHIRGGGNRRRRPRADVQCTGVPRMSSEHRHGRRQPDRRAPHRAPGIAAIRRVGGWVADPVAFDTSGHLRERAFRRQRQHVPHLHQLAGQRASSRPSPTTRCWPSATRSLRRFVAGRWKWRCSRRTMCCVSADSDGRVSTPAWNRLRRTPI